MYNIEWKSKPWFRGPFLDSNKSKYAKQDQVGVKQTSTRAKC